MEFRVKNIVFVKVIIIIMACVLAIAFNQPSINTIIALLIWISGFIYSIRDIKNRFALFAFEVGYFVFLLGGYTINFFKTSGFSYFTNSNETIVHTTLSVCVSLGIVTSVSILMHERIKRNNEARVEITDKNELKEDVNDPTESNEDEVNSNEVFIPRYYRITLFVLVLFSFICQLIETIVETTYILSTSYLVDTSAVLNELPRVIYHGASYYYISLFLYLATFPTKKKAIIVIITGFFIAFLTLISGRRGEPIALILAIVYYIILRNRKGIRDIIIKKKVIVVMVILLPLFVVFLQQLGATRVNRQFTSNTIDAIGSFFEDQGGSVRIVANGYDSRDRITEIGGRTYLLGEFRGYLKNNIFTQLIFGTKVGTRYERAMSGDQYSATYNYLYLSAYSFESGIGSGTTYIAEAFHDGGYLMLLIISIYIGFLISVLDTSSKLNHPIWTGIFLNIMRYIALLPRGYSFAWLTNTFAIQNLVLFLLCYLLLHNKRSA